MLSYSVMFFPNLNPPPDVFELKLNISESVLNASTPSDIAESNKRGSVRLRLKFVLIEDKEAVRLTR